MEVLPLLSVFRAFSFPDACFQDGVWVFETANSIVISELYEQKILLMCDIFSCNSYIILGVCD